MVNPLTQLSLDELRRRTSVKWRMHAEDVLPLWVAEMDVPLAAPVARGAAPTRSTRRHRLRLRDGVRGGARRLRRASGGAGTGSPSARTAMVPDVMLGVVEVLRLRHRARRRGGGLLARSTRRSTRSSAHADRRVVEAPLGADRRIDLAPWRRPSAGARRRRPAAFLLCSPHNPTGVVHTARRARPPSPRWPTGTAYGWSPTRSTRRWSLRRRTVHAVPQVPGAEDAFALMSASKAWNLAGLQGGARGRRPGRGRRTWRRMPEEVGHGAEPPRRHRPHRRLPRRRRRGWTLLLDGLDANRELLAALLAEHLPGRPLPARPEGTYLAWLDCTGLGVDRLGDDPAWSATRRAGEVFLDHGRVALSSGHVFGTGGGGLRPAQPRHLAGDPHRGGTRMGRAVAEHQAATG